MSYCEEWLDNEKAHGKNRYEETPDFSNIVPYYKNTINIDLDGETWKDVIGYEGLYSVSIFGRIRSHLRNRILKQFNAGNRTLQVTLCADGNRNKISVSQVVAFTYIGYPDKNRKECICHIDKNPKNNTLKNLSIETRHNSRLLDYNEGVLVDWGIKNVGSKTQFVSKYYYVGTDKKGNIKKYIHSELFKKYGSGVRSILRCIEKEKRYKTAYKQTWTKELIKKECRYFGNDEGKAHACNNHNGICEKCCYFK